MKRSGFTMIELIFVIVILGILAAVALPKFIGVSEQAQVAKLKAYVGSLNRTVAPAVWSQSISTGNAGSIKSATHSYQADINASLPPLENVQDNGTSFGSPVVTNCVLPTTIAAPGAIGLADTNITAAGGMIATGSVGGKSYYVKCIDGNMTSAPQFWLTDGAVVVSK